MSEHVDVLIVGAGLSGIGAASHLQRECPGKSFAILESRGTVGGTWDLFRYPGIRSDSDMYTMGYSFRPWTNAKAIADGESIRTYITDTLAQEGLQPHLRLNHRVVSAEWSSASALWTVTAVRTSEAEYPGEHAAQDPGVDAAANAVANAAADSAEAIIFTCSFLSVCSGYYRYDQGFTPAIPGADSFAGLCIRSTGRPIWTTKANASSSSAAVPPP
jgi:cation diffusion facilitator CzcD-associated flavoprotein CzcO